MDRKEERLTAAKCRFLFYLTLNYEMQISD